jgi:hypothetical protein
LQLENTWYRDTLVPRYSGMHEVELVKVETVMKSSTLLTSVWDLWALFRSVITAVDWHKYNDLSLLRRVEINEGGRSLATQPNRQSSQIQRSTGRGAAEVANHFKHQILRRGDC